MRARLSLLLLFFAALPAAGQDLARFFPLDEGNRWVWDTFDSDRGDWYYRLEVIGDTLIGGEPYALATTTRLTPIYNPLDTARCAVRVVPYVGTGYIGRIDVLPVAGTSYCLPPFVGGIPENSFPMTFDIGGISYHLEEVAWMSYDLHGIGHGEEYVGAGVGPLEAHFGYVGSHGGGGLGSRLLYAEVGDDVYGVEPVSAGEAPAPERYYPLAAGDTWVYEYYSDVIGSVVERREVLRDTTLEGDPYALLAVARFEPDTYVPLDEALCAVRIDSGDIVWRAVEGECAVPEASFADAFWWVPLGWTQNVRADCDGTIGGTQYNFPFCFSISFSPPPPGWNTSISIGFAVDVGLLRFIVVLNGQELSDGWLRYARVGGVEYGEPVPVASELPVGVQPALAMEAVYPNPFRGSAAVAFTLPAPEAVTVAVFDALGRRVLTRDLGRLGAGRHTVTLDGATLAPGVYVVRVAVGEVSATTRVVRAE